MAIGPNPAFSWSHSRARMVEQGACARRYRYQYYLSHLGWDIEAPPEAQLAYRLKQLTTIDLAIGVRVHNRAAEIAQAFIEGEQPQSLEASEKRSRNEMNQIWQASKDPRAFVRRPRRHPMLLEVYYNHPISNERLQRAKAKLTRCLKALHEWNGWHDIAAADRESIILPDAPEPVTIRDVPVFGVPDLVWRDDAAWEIIDFKTGTIDGAKEQLALYALCLQERGIIAGDAEVRGRVVGLSTYEDEILPISDADMAAVQRRLRDSLSQMRTYVVEMDLDRNEALPADRFPYPPTTDHCRWCPFQEICDKESATYFGPF